MSVHTNVVPDYPYNVHQPVHPSHGAAAMAPDDNEISTNLPKICVDYLSHNWTEEDIWASWKTMTKTKAERTNGMRLENASWRTWAKQRNHLKTISPETLNWLKDSDVTWLYGPLHTADEEPAMEIQQLQREHESEKARKEEEAEKARAASENRPAKGSPQSPSSNDASAADSASTVPAPAPAPGPRAAAAQTQPEKSKTRSKRSKSQASPMDQKSILKRRSLTDILLSPEMVELLRDARGKGEDVSHARFLRTSSDSNLTGLGSHNFGPFPNATASSTASSSSASLEPDFKDREGPKSNKHISFNRNVEQYIAVDSDHVPHAYIDASDSSDSEAFSPSSYSYLDHKESGSFDHSYDSDDDVLTFGSRPRVPFVQNTSKKHKLIAPLNTTSLKNIDLTQWPNSSQDFHAPVVPAPAKGSRYVNGEANQMLQPSDSDISTSDNDDDDDEDDSSSNQLSLENLHIDEIPSPETSINEGAPSVSTTAQSAAPASASDAADDAGPARAPTTERGRGRSAHRATCSDRSQVHHRVHSRSRSSESLGISSDSNNSGGDSSVSTSDSSNSSDASDSSASHDSSSSDSSPSDGPPEPRPPSEVKMPGNDDSTADSPPAGTNADQKSTPAPRHVDNAAPSDDAPDGIIGRTAGNVWSWSRALWN